MRFKILQVFVDFVSRLEKAGQLNKFQFFSSSPFWSLDCKNWIQYTDKVLVKETSALVFSVSLDFRKILECHSKGVTLPLQSSL